MATTAQLLNLTYGQYNNSDQVHVCSKAETMHVFLPACFIAYSLRVSISAGVPSTSG
jgi:hypothetical protein